MIRNCQLQTVSPRRANKSDTSPSLIPRKRLMWTDHQHAWQTGRTSCAKFANESLHFAFRTSHGESNGHAGSSSTLPDTEWHPHHPRLRALHVDSSMQAWLHGTGAGCSRMPSLSLTTGISQGDSTQHVNCICLVNWRIRSHVQMCCHQCPVRAGMFDKKLMNATILQPCTKQAPFQPSTVARRVALAWKQAKSTSATNTSDLQSFRNLNTITELGLCYRLTI